MQFVSGSDENFRVRWLVWECRSKHGEIGSHGGSMFGFMLVQKC